MIIQQNDIREGEESIFQFKTEEIRDAFIQGVDFVNDSDISYTKYETDGELFLSIIDSKD